MFDTTNTPFTEKTCNIMNIKACLELFKFGKAAEAEGKDYTFEELQAEFRKIEQNIYNEYRDEQTANLSGNCPDSSSRSNEGHITSTQN